MPSCLGLGTIFGGRFSHVLLAGTLASVGVCVVAFPIPNSLFNSISNSLVENSLWAEEARSGASRGPIDLVRCPVRIELVRHLEHRNILPVF
jgi:hypothetical protein